MTTHTLFPNITITNDYIHNLLNDYGCNFKPNNIKLYEKAFIHKSLKDEFSDYDEHNCFERLKFLGDSVIRLILTEYLFDRYEHENEGFLTKLRTKIETNATLSKISLKMKLNDYIIVEPPKIYDSSQPNEEHVYSKINYKMLIGELIKTFVGVLYKDESYDICKKFVINVIEKELDIAEILCYDINYKEYLLQYYHKMKWKDPLYVVLENPIDNYQKKYVICAKNGNDDNLIGIGFGLSKLQAEQQSAKQALEYHNVDVTNLVDKNDDKNDDNKEDIMKYILNPKNISITEYDVNKMFKMLGFDMQINDIELYKEAFVHKSYTTETSKKIKLYKQMIDSNKIKPVRSGDGVMKIQNKSYERLEFLGDSVIRLILSEFIYDKYKYEPEGFMTKLRTNIENGKILGFLTQKLKLNNFLVISTLEEINNGRYGKIEVLGDVFEALFGALYKDLGKNVCEKVLIQLINKEINLNEIIKNDTNYKDQLLRYFHTKKMSDPKYELIGIIQPTKICKNPESKQFHVVLKNDGKIISDGYGISKLVAEQDAAKRAMDIFVF